MARFKQKYMGGNNGEFLSFNIDENNLSNEVIFIPTPLVATEIDPVYSASPASTITQSNINKWNKTPTNWINGQASGSVRTLDSAAEGSNDYYLGMSAVAEGYDTRASGTNSHAEGGSTTSSGANSHAEGASTEAFGANSHAEGSYTTASQYVSHAEGTSTAASGYASHAEGNTTIASGSSSHAEGARTAASGFTSHAEGSYTTASGDSSHAEGYYTIANHKSQHAIGEYNIADPSTATNTNRGNYVEIVGNGTSSNARSNARTLDWSGNEVLAGKLTVGTGPTNNMDVATKQYVDSATAGLTDTTNGKIGDLANLTTTNKSNLVTAINEINAGGGGSSSSSNNLTMDMEWQDVYSDWQGGYYYDPDNGYAYTQIPSTETTWSETQTYISTSCTPYNNLIPVVAGERYRYLNMPVHFDSKNAEIPSIIIFDSTKARLASYTRGYNDNYTDFIIPIGGEWMAVVYANNQSYTLQKYVAKTHFEDEILNEVKSSYRTRLLTPQPTPRALTKGYICIGTDDLRPAHTKNLHDMFTTTYDIPYYMAAIPTQIKQCVIDDPYKTNLDYMRLCVANGGEIISHSGDDLVITETNKNNFDNSYAYFCKSKKELESYGFKVRGIFKAGGTNAIYDAADPAIDSWATHYYDFGDYFTTSFPFYSGRTLLDDWESYSTLTTAIQNICDNHTFGIFAFHYYNSNAALAMQTIMNALSGYTEGVDYEFVTPSQLYDLLIPQTQPSSGGGSGGSSVTYSLSISGNRITLTPSSGSATYVDLPLYNGGVQ